MTLRFVSSLILLCIVGGCATVRPDGTRTSGFYVNFEDNSETIVVDRRPDKDTLEHADDVRHACEFSTEPYEGIRVQRSFYWSRLPSVRDSFGGRYGIHDVCKQACSNSRDSVVLCFDRDRADVFDSVADGTFWFYVHDTIMNRYVYRWKDDTYEYTTYRRSKRKKRFDRPDTMPDVLEVGPEGSKP